MTDRLTRRQGAIVSAYTGILACRFADFHEYVEEILDRPVWTHEFASEKVTEEIKAASLADFLLIVASDEGTITRF